MRAHVCLLLYFPTFEHLYSQYIYILNIITTLYILLTPFKFLLAEETKSALHKWIHLYKSLSACTCICVYMLLLINSQTHKGRAAQLKNQF